MNKFIPKKVLLKVYYFLLFNYYKISIGFYHLGRALRYSANPKTRNGWLGSMRMRCHVLEKGLTMPNTRYGFGQARILDIVNLLLENRQYEKEEEYTYAIGLLKEYLNLHIRNKQELPVSFRNSIEEITNNYPNIPPVKQIETTTDEYFSCVNAAFPLFNKSRRTVRYFENSASFDDVQEAIELAGFAPSACNRQPVKCHYFEGEMVQSILRVQTGNNGFGHLAPQLIVLTTDVSMVGVKEYYDAFTNTGIFAMNLVYSLYYKKIASCILNWSVIPKDDKLLRKITGIPNHETIVLMVLLGKTPNNFKIALSKRQSVSEYLIRH